MKQIIKNKEEKTSVKKAGPYTERQRLQRQNKVYLMHFEQGYSAVRIANELGVSRNTINSDIQYLYSTIQNDDDNISLDDFINKQRLRFELQRNRLMNTLENTNSLQEKLQLEKLIFDIDSKLTNTYLKINDSKIKSWDEGVRFINKWMEKNGKKDRFLLSGDLITTSENRKKRAFDILEGNN